MASKTAAAEQEERLKSSLWYALGQFIDEYTAEKNLNATPQFIGALTELVYTQIANAARDLETFSKHGGRRVINTDDVMLLGRRNEAIEFLLKERLDQIRAEEGRGMAQGTKRKGRPAGVGKGKAKQ